MPDLAADKDLEPVRTVVTAIALVAVDAANGNPCKLFEVGDDETDCITVVRICRAVQHELPSLWRGDRRNKRDLAAELVGSSCLAAADALHLEGVQRTDLRPALTRLLMAHTRREIE